MPKKEIRLTKENQLRFEVKKLKDNGYEIVSVNLEPATAKATICYIEKEE